MPDATLPSPSRVHLAIVEPCYLDLILSGEKTIECRLSRTRREPLGSVWAGERIYFKARGGRVGCSAVVTRVDEYLDLSAAGIQRLRERYDALVRGSDEFWRSRLAARYAMFAHLGEPRCEERGPLFKPKVGDRRAWFVLPASLSPPEPAGMPKPLLSSTG